MAHPSNEEAGGSFTSEMDDAASALSDFLESEKDRDLDNQGQDDDDAEEGEEPEDGDEPEDDDDQDGDELTGAIEAPVSLTAEEKAKFAQLPLEAQRYVAELEGRRASQVQSATTKAAEAQRTAEMRAAQADAQAKAVYAQQLRVMADNYAPQPPDPMLAQTNPAAYIAYKAQYDEARAQHDNLMQQVAELHQTAETQLTHAEKMEIERELMAVPEIQNPETRGQFFEKAHSAAARLGLDLSGLQHANASEWKALRMVNDAFEKAEKYDAAKAKTMQVVRDGKKSKAMKPNAAKPAAGERAYRDARSKLRSSGDLHDAASAIARLG